MGKYVCRSRVRSCRNTKAKRATQFKKGHSGFNKNKLYKENLPDNSYVESPTIERRLNVTEAGDVIHLSQNVDNIPYRLRPRPENNGSKSASSSRKNIDGNIIVSVEKLQELLQYVHQCQSNEFKINIEKRQGLHVSLTGTCNKCKMVTPEFGMSEAHSKPS